MLEIEFVSDRVGIISKGHLMVTGRADELKERYPEFTKYEGKCRFRECLHDREPGCAVTEAAAQGMISQGRLDRYRALLAETREVWRERYD